MTGVWQELGGCRPPCHSSDVALWRRVVGAGADQPSRTRRPTMTTTATTSTRTTPGTAPRTSLDELAGALDGLATAAEQARDDAPTRAVLAVVVQRLEAAAGAALGDACGEPLVVLQRRFGRAHARLAARSSGEVDADLLHGLARALAPDTARAPRGGLRSVPVPALAGC